MNVEELKTEILQLIHDHDGEWSWYQLDRALAYGDNLPLLHRLSEFLHHLTSEGLIKTEGEEPHPRYVLTDAGRDRIAHIIAA